MSALPKLLIQPVARSGAARALIRIGAVVLGLAIAGLLISLAGKNAFTVFGTMFSDAFGSDITQTLVRTVPLLLCGLGIALAARMQLWNIGAEGQFFMGAFAATGVAMKFSHLPAVALLPLMALAGFVAGGLWCLLPGLFRAYWGASETITTLLLNYVAFNIVLYFIYGPWKDPKSMGFPLTPQFPANAILPSLGGRVHAGLLVALLAAVVLWYVLRGTRWGYEIRVIGQSPTAARYAGMNIVRNVLLVMFVAGALAGLAGMIEVSGLVHRLHKDVSPGYGYTAIIVAYLAQLDPLALIFVSFLFGGLQAGAYSVQMQGVPLATAYMIQGAILFCVLGAELFTRHQIRFQRRKEAA